MIWHYDTQRPVPGSKLLRKVARKQEWWSLALFSIPHRVYHTWYTLWLVNFDCLLQHVRQSFAVLLPDSNKHVEHVKPSYTAPFDVLTFEILSRETVFQKVGVFEYLKRWLKAASFFLPTFFRSFAILLLARIFPRAHWPKVWHRLGTHILAGSNSGLFFFTLQHQTGQTGAVGLPVVQLVEAVQGLERACATILHHHLMVTCTVLDYQLRQKGARFAIVQVSLDAL